MLRSITTGVPGVLWLQKSLFSSFYVGKIHKFRITKVSVRNTMYIIKAWCYNLDTSKAHFQGCYVEPEAIKMILRDHAIGSYRSSTLKMKSIKKYFENHSSAVCVFPKTVVIMDNHQTLVIQLIPHRPFKFQIMLFSLYGCFSSSYAFGNYRNPLRSLCCPPRYCSQKWFYSSKARSTHTTQQYSGHWWTLHHCIITQLLHGSLKWKTKKVWRLSFPQKMINPLANHLTK